MVTLQAVKFQKTWHANEFLLELKREAQSILGISLSLSLSLK